MGDFDKLILTAWLAAYWRSFTDIPLSRDIFTQLERLRQERHIEVDDELLSAQLAPQLEARYLLVERLMQENQSDQVLELAAGFSGRGLVMAQDPAITYIETDLPDVVMHKRKIVDAVARQRGIAVPAQLYIAAVDATSLQSVAHATSRFEQRPVSVVNEGLLRYMDLEQKTLVGRAVRAVLHQYGGVWINPDISFTNPLQFDAEVRKHRELVGSRTGISVDSNRFKSEAEARRFYTNLGFSVEPRSFLEVRDSLVSPERTGVSAQRVDALIGSAVAYVLRLDKYAGARFLAA